jgi:hypothetical protein
MRRRNIRVHLRHSGDTKLRFGITRLRPYSIRTRDGIETIDHWGYNIHFGRWALDFRDRNLDRHHKSNRFFDLGFGRAMLKNQRLRNSMSEEEHIAYDYIRSEGKYQGIRLEYFLKLYRSGDLTWPMS